MIIEYFQQLIERETIDDTVISAFDIILELATEQKVQGSDLILFGSNSKMFHNISVIRRVAIIVRVPKPATIEDQNIDIITPGIDNFFRMCQFLLDCDR